MKTILTKLTCNHCGYMTHKKSETLILPDFEPVLRDALLAETFFTHTCPSCHHVLSFFHSCLYIDKKHDFILLMKPKEDDRELENLLYEIKVKTTKRYLYNASEVKEKLQILEDSLNDKAVELVKAKLLIRGRKKKPFIDEIAYHDYDPISKTMWFRIVYEHEEGMIAIPDQEYTKMLTVLAKQDHEEFEHITTKWALSYITKH